MQWNFPGRVSTTRGRSTSTFFPGRTNPTDAAGNSWNWPIGLQHFRNGNYSIAKAAAGRLSAHQHVPGICSNAVLATYGLELQHLKKKEKPVAKAAWVIIYGSSWAIAKDGWRPSERTSIYASHTGSSECNETFQSPQPGEGRLLRKTNPTDATGNLWNWPIGLQHFKRNSIARWPPAVWALIWYFDNKGNLLTAIEEKNR